MYRQHLIFIPFQNFTTLRNVDMLVIKELAREIVNKATNT